MWLHPLHAASDSGKGLPKAPTPPTPSPPAQNAQSQRGPLIFTPLSMEFSFHSSVLSPREKTRMVTYLWDGPNTDGGVERIPILNWCLWAHLQSPSWRGLCIIQTRWLQLLCAIRSLSCSLRIWTMLCGNLLIFGDKSSV